MRQTSVVATTTRSERLENVTDVSVLDNGVLRVIGDGYVTVYAAGAWLTVTTTAAVR